MPAEFLLIIGVLVIGTVWIIVKGEDDV